MIYRDSKGHIRVIPENIIRLAILLMGLIIGFYLCKGVQGKASVLESLGINVSHNAEEVKLLADLINLENGDSNIRMYYTGCVVLNRKESKRFPNTIHDVIYQTKPCKQYAVAQKIGTKKISKEAYLISFCLLTFGHNIPKSCVYQSRFEQGSKVWKIIDGEYFCLE